VSGAVPRESRQPSLDFPPLSEHRFSDLACNAGIVEHLKSLKNVSASVRHRIRNRAKKDKRPFNEILQYYAMERFLYRLSQSVHADNFILKGTLTLRVWRSPEFRSTMDIDSLGKTNNEEASIVAQIREIIAANVEPDGLTFDPDSIRSERITEGADYEGLRIRFLRILDSARINMQIDIGFEILSTLVRKNLICQLC